MDTTDAVAERQFIAICLAYFWLRLVPLGLALALG